jgi:hypothetical protein
MGKMIKVCKILVGKSEGKSDLGGLGVDGKIVIKWILNK